MKNTFSILTIFIIANVFAQAPQKMSYQTVVRNSNGELVDSANVGIKISLLQGSTNGTVVYVETHNVKTNANGLASLEIGTGTILTGTFDSINWANGHYFLKTETDPTGGANYTIIGTSQLLSVPYALYAENVNTSSLNTGIFYNSFALNNYLMANSKVIYWDWIYYCSTLTCSFSTYRDYSFLVPRSGQLKNLLAIPLSDTVATGSVATVKILLNGMPTPLSVTFTDTDAGMKSNAATTVNVVKGDFIAFQWLETGGVAPGTSFKATVELK
jgi:hypothetical protein